MNYTEPLCSAPFKSIMIDTNKKVFPCVAWAGDYIGDLNKEQLSDILKNPVLEETQIMLSKQQWPDACRTCKNREEQTGKSTRLDTYVNIKTEYSKKISHIEFDSSNLCNLLCIGCSPLHSSSWYYFNKDTGVLNRPETEDKQWKLYLPNSSVSEYFNDIDLSELTSLWFKGGEPFLNKENILLLEYLDKLNVLKNINIKIMTNGTIYNQTFHNLLSKSKEVHIHVSIDGLGDHNVWLRSGYEKEDIAHTDGITDNIKKYLKLENLSTLGDTYTINALNVTRLEEFKNWWQNTIMVLDDRIRPIMFKEFILWPEFLSARVLSDSFRFALADHYEKMQDDCYESVINFLRLPYHNPNNDHHWHNKLVDYVKQLDCFKSRKFESIVPELTSELVLL